MFFFLVVLAHEPLRVTLEDLHSAETKGKWWLVGAAWGGDPLVDRQQTSTTASTSTSAQNDGDASASSSNTLLKLAKRHGMNTDIRRSIFIVLMSSDVIFLFSHNPGRTCAEYRFFFF